MVTNKDKAIAENIIFQGLPVDGLARYIHKVRVDAAEDAVASHIREQANFRRKKDERQDRLFKKFLDYFSSKQNAGNRK